MDEPYPVQLTITRPERSSRLKALLLILFVFPKLVLLVPHLIALWALSIVMFIATILGAFAVLFTGQYPPSFFELITNIYRWQMRVNAFLFGLTDRYPPFRLS